MNLKKFISACMLTITLMVSSLGVTMAAGETPTPPSEADRAYAILYLPSIQGNSNVGLEMTDISLYRVVKATYNEFGLVGYERMSYISETDIADICNPTASEVTALARKILTTDGAGFEKYEARDYNKLSGRCRFPVPAGSYIAIVKNSTGEYIYNPTYLSVGYEDASDASSLHPDTSYWRDPSFGGVYLKQSYTTLDKDIVNAGTGNTETEDVAIGDAVSFKITTTMPDYSDFHTNPVFRITDTYCAGLDAPTGIVVKANNTVITENKDYNLTSDTTARTFTITFTDAFIKANPMTPIEVTYSAVVNNSALIADANNNHASLTFTTTPDETYEYTDDVNVYTYEFIAKKVDGTDNTIPLEGAEFSLTRADGKIYTATSDINGKISFTGLDAGNYTLKETKAPTDYALSASIYDVVISATYDTDADGTGAGITYGYGILPTARSAYANEKMANWTVTVTKADGTQVSEAVFTADSPNHESGANIPNTTLAKLPSTGGMGTFAFTFGGSVVALLGVAMLLRKKSVA